MLTQIIFLRNDPFLAAGLKQLADPFLAAGLKQLARVLHPLSRLCAVPA